MLSSGSVVRRGEGNGVVLFTGAKTYFGRTTDLVQHAQPKLHIDAVVSKVVRWLFVIVGALLAVVVTLSLVRRVSLLELIPLVLVLLMSAVPVALPVMFTVSMALGSKELAKSGVLVTRLSATEDAATMDVLCVDKTGTLTMNQFLCSVRARAPLVLGDDAEQNPDSRIAGGCAHRRPPDASRSLYLKPLLWSQTLAISATPLPLEWRAPPQEQDGDQSHAHACILSWCAPKRPASPLGNGRHLVRARLLRDAFTPIRDNRPLSVDTASCSQHREKHHP